MSTETNQPGSSRETCIEEAAAALARCYAGLETETAPAEARAV